MRAPTTLTRRPERRSPWRRRVALLGCVAVVVIAPQVLHGDLGLLVAGIAMLIAATEEGPEHPAKGADGRTPAPPRDRADSPRMVDHAGQEVVMSHPGSGFSRFVAAVAGLAVSTACGAALGGRAHAEEAPEGPAHETREADEAPEAPEAAEAQCVLIGVPCWERLHDRIEKGREASPFALGFGAEHWVNVNRETGTATYGYPGAEGTYIWWVTADLEVPLSCREGCERSWGAHLDVEWRERTRFAEYYDSRLWLQEAYLFADVLGGRVRAGTIPTAFGLEGDGTWWGTLPYYDGLMQDTDWGVDFTRTLVERPRWTLKGTAQLFLAENHVGGALVGGDAESNDDLDEGPIGMLRLESTWTRGCVEWKAGASVLGGSLRGQNGASDEDLLGLAGDLTFTRGPLSLFGAVYWLDGARHPEHYVTGGPTSGLVDAVLGATYKLGPFTPHVAWSAGWLSDPGGDQQSIVAGTDVALLRKVNLYLEYVYWVSQADGDVEVVQEDGFQLILGWEF